MDLLFDVLIAHWGGEYGMGPGMMGWGYGMGGFGWILMAVFWVAVIVAVILLIRWAVTSTKAAGYQQGTGSALEVLKIRYAKGEIDKEEFEQKKKDLS